MREGGRESGWRLKPGLDYQRQKEMGKAVGDWEIGPESEGQ